MITPTNVSVPEIKPDLKAKVLALVASFEGGLSAVAGNFDGMVMSYGPLQWNIGQGTLQPIMKDLAERHPSLLTTVVGPEFRAACVQDEGLRRYVEDQGLLRDGSLAPEFKYKMKQLALTPECQEAFVRGAEDYFQSAGKLAVLLGLITERGYALCFDVAVQNGAPRKDHVQGFQIGYAALGPDKVHEWAKLKLLATVVADCANPRWRNDVLARKLGIALGGTKMSGLPVHGQHFDLERDFGISYERGWSVREEIPATPPEDGTA